MAAPKNQRDNADAFDDLLGQLVDELAMTPTSKSSDPSFSTAPTVSKTFLVKSNDNENAVFYDESVFQMANIISILSIVIAALTLFLLILGIFARKLIGI